MYNMGPEVILFVMIAMTLTFLLVILAIWSSKKSEKEQQQTEQPSDVQQSANKRILIDAETFNNIYMNVDTGVVIFTILVISVLFFLIAVEDYLAKAALGFIAILSALGLVVLLPTSTKMNKIRPKKVRKIVKVTTVYSDGTTVEKETKYEY